MFFLRLSRTHTVIVKRSQAHYDQSTFTTKLRDVRDTRYSICLGTLQTDLMRYRVQSPYIEKKTHVRVAL